MPEAKPGKSASGSAIKVAVDIETQIDGKSTIRLGDGTEIDGPSRQRFERISPDIVKGFPADLNEDDWLLNPATKEVHQVVSIAFGVVGEIAITTKTGTMAVTLKEVAETLLRVVNEE